MTTDKRKEQNREGQKSLRERRKEEGWKFLWIPPHLIQTVRDLIKNPSAQGGGVTAKRHTETSAAENKM